MSEVNRYAIRRPSDDDEESPVATPPKPAVPTPAEATHSPESAGRSQARSRPAPIEAAPAVGGDPATAQSVAAPPDALLDSSDIAALSDTQSPPQHPLAPQARTDRTIQNIERIAAALEAHAQATNILPARAIFDPSGRPLLSWRVALLPYLEYEELYAQFRLEEPWDSPHNRRLLPLIPSVFQSPDRFDERTNYLVPVHANTIFARNRGIRPEAIEDGASNTAILVEVDDALAVAWTEPRDYELDLNEPAKGWGALRGGSGFVVWGDGQTGRVLTTTPKHLVKAMFTHDSGEDFLAGHVNQPLRMAAPPNATVAASGIADAQPAGDPSRGAPQNPSAGAGPAAISSPSGGDALGLAATYRDRLTDALSQGSERDALHWFYAAAIASPPGGDWAGEYRWIPALRRPAPALRFGVGLAYSGPREQAVQRAATDTSGRGRSGSGGPPVWSGVTGEFGKQIVESLAAHLEGSAGEMFGGPLPSGLRRPRGAAAELLRSSHAQPISPGVIFLTVAREPILLQAARRESVDVLVVVDWRDAGNRWSAGVKLVDVVRGETLLALPRLQSAQLEKSRTDPLADNPLLEFVRRLNEFLEELVGQPLPPQLQPRHARQRLDVLAASEPDNPLAALAEMRLYEERGLVDRTQLLLAYQGLVGAAAGSELLLGDAAAKDRLLKPWLPLPASKTSSVRSVSRRADDDD